MWVVGRRTNGAMDPQPQPHESANRYALGRVPQFSTGLATASLICGLAGLVLCIILSPFSLILVFILGPLAIIFGAIGMSQANKNPIGAGKGMARAGLILGILDILIMVALIFLVVSR